MQCLSETEVSQLIEDHMGLVVKLAKSFKPQSPEQLDEYIQVGRIGLWKAILKRDPTRGALSTIAWICIRNELLRHVKWLNRGPASYEVIEHSYNTEPAIWEVLPGHLLNEKEVKVVELRYEGHTFKEIGEMCGYTKNWAHKCWTQAVRKIKQANE